MSSTASIVTWNINSLRARHEHVVTYLREYQPDIVLLQELKLEEARFPYEQIEECGYNCAVYGQKTYNGVAILSKTPLDDITKGLDETDAQARYIEATTCIEGQLLRVASIYVPNGQAVDSDKFAYKMRFFDTLRTHCQTLLRFEEPLILGGDYNVAYLPQDVYDPEKLNGTVCYHPDERAHLRALLHLGLYDAYRTLHPEENGFSWWDYRGGGFARNHGLRIDHLLLSPEATDRLSACDIDREERERDKPSDHAPVRMTLQL
jgi:exodeoxyribonuclease-3